MQFIWEHPHIESNKKHTHSHLLLVDYYCYLTMRVASRPQWTTKKKIVNKRKRTFVFSRFFRCCCCCCVEQEARVFYSRKTLATKRCQRNCALASCVNLALYKCKPIRSIHFCMSRKMVRSMLSLSHYFHLCFDVRDSWNLYTHTRARWDIQFHCIVQKCNEEDPTTRRIFIFFIHLESSFFFVRCLSLSVFLCIPCIGTID